MTKNLYIESIINKKKSEELLEEYTKLKPVNEQNDLDSKLGFNEGKFLMKYDLDAYIYYKNILLDRTLKYLINNSLKL